MSIAMTRGGGDIAAARQWASFFREKGYQPLPSDPEAKKPLIRYAEYWEADAPANLFDRHPTTNLQVMTGRFWGLMVIDLDGPEAVELWPSMAPCCPRTWITHSGGGGQHVWFSLPRNLPPMPKARLWGEWDATARDGRGDWSPRKAIERLCDRSLVMAPPSIHPKTGRKYRFLAGSSPREVSRPAMAPAWVLSLKPMESPRPRVFESAPVARKAPSVPVGERYDARDVSDAIMDKIALVASWGLRIASQQPNANGWVACHAIGREDRDPSAGFNVHSGRYCEPGAGVSLGMFDIGVQLAGYGTWQECCNDLGARFCFSPSPVLKSSLNSLKNSPTPTKGN